MHRTILSIACSLMLLGCAGGSDTPELATVSGTVTLDEEALPNATVLFTPIEGGRPSAGVTDDGGYYYLEYSPGNSGATPGKHQVTITTGTTITDAEGNDVEVPEMLPMKYNVETELQEEVTNGANEIDFDLDSEGEIYVESEEDAENPDSPSC